MVLSAVLARMPSGPMPIYQYGDIRGGWSSPSGKAVTVETAKNVVTVS